MFGFGQCQQGTLNKSPFLKYVIWGCKEIHKEIIYDSIIEMKWTFHQTAHKISWPAGVLSPLISFLPAGPSQQETNNPSPCLFIWPTTVPLRRHKKQRALSIRTKTSANPRAAPICSEASPPRSLPKRKGLRNGYDGTPVTWHDGTWKSPYRRP